MDIKTAKRVSQITEGSVFKRCGYEGGHGSVNNKVCIHWLAGRCSRNPCKFMHREYPPTQPKQTCLMYEDRINIRSKSTWINPNYYNPKKQSGEVVKGIQETQGKSLTNGGTGIESKNTQKTQKRLCKYWVSGNCVRGDKCRDMHSWFCGTGFSMLAKLEGHDKAVTGVALPSGSDKLYSGSKDKSVRVWDCRTGKCAGVIDLGCETGSLIAEGPWIFVGLSNAIKAWNLETQSELVLDGPVGLVCAMVVGNDMFFAGTEDGTILAWKSNSKTNCHELAPLLRGHSRAVLSLIVGARRLYSGSMDKTIRVWDLETWQCMQTLDGHTDVVMSVLCWESYLLSGSLDNTIKVWAAGESGNLEVVYELKEEHGVLALCGIHDGEAKPILLCSCNDDTVRLYELPSFNERGRIFAKQEVRVIQIGPGGLFFTGDAAGQLFVWRLHGESGAVAS